MRVRLVGLVVVTTSLVLVAFLVPLAVLVRNAAAERAQNVAVEQLQALAPTVASFDEASLQAVVAQTNADGTDQVTVFLPGGALVGAPVPRSANVDLAASGRSFTADVPGGREVLVAVAGLPAGTAVIRTFIPEARLRNGVAVAWLVLGLLGLGLLAVSVAVADLLARTVVRPLTSVAGVSHRLAQGDLAARATVDGPVEVRAVGSGLNRLAERIGELLAREREAAADLSHRLRTPLTALRIDVESVADPVEQARLVADVDALQHSVDEIIRAARRPAVVGMARCDATRIVADRAAFWWALADEEGRAMRVDLPDGPVTVRVSDADLIACVDALLGNVFSHTPEGTGMSLSLVALPAGGARLTIVDDGPGLSDPDAVRRGHSGAGSTGLGLDIVRRTAVDSGGTVTVGNAFGAGAMVRLDLGGPPPAPAGRGRRRPPRGRA